MVERAGTRVEQQEWKWKEWAGLGWGVVVGSRIDHSDAEPIHLFRRAKR